MAQGELKDYQEAEKWLWCNIENKIYNSNISPNWISEGDAFWYTTKTRKGNEYFLVDIKKKKKSQLFDHKRMADLVSTVLNKEYSTYDLKLSKVKLDQNKSISFQIDTSRLRVNLNDYSLVKQEKIKTENKTELSSPDKKKIAFIKDYNIYLRNIEANSEMPLSTDGNAQLSYGTSVSWYFVKNESAHQKDQFEIDATWSPNSRYLICAKYNRKHAKNLYMYKSSPEDGFRAEVHSYERPIAGDKDLTRISYTIFDTKTGSEIKCDLPENGVFLEYSFKWLNNTKAYTTRYYRGYQKRGTD